MSWTILSVFTGAGALDYAFESTGRFSTAVAIDCQPEFCDTLRGNQARGVLARAAIVQDDIRSLDPRTCWDAHLPGESPAGLIGGPPCESFTPIGKKLGRSDPRGLLLFTFTYWARQLPFRFVLLENVPGVAAWEDGAILQELVDALTSCGYATSHAILNAADFGAATIRRRLFVVGIRSGPAYVFPKPTHAMREDGRETPDRQPWATVRMALAGLPPPHDGRPGVPEGHVRIRHTEVVSRRFAALSPGAWDDVRRRARLSLDRPSPSLYAGNLEGVRGHIHPVEPRELTNRELARIHGFPDWFTFSGGRVCEGKQIANAVPIPLGLAVARSLADQLARSEAGRRATARKGKAG